MPHAAVGGSAIARILRCPGSVRLCAGLPPVTSPAADRGTALHYFLAQMFNRSLEPGALVGQSYAGYRLEAGDAKSMLIPARAMTWRFIGDCVPRLEQRVRFEKNVWGTADMVAHRAHIGYLADYKFGSHPVDPRESEQLKFYAAAAWEQKKFGSQPVAVHATIIQPAVSLQFTVVRYTPEELAEFARAVRAIAKVALAPGAPVIAGEIQCKWCAAKQTCPAIQRGGGDLARALADLKLRV